MLVHSYVELDRSRAADKTKALRIEIQFTRRMKIIEQGVVMLCRVS
jgi:hypothetical protein